MGSKKYHIDWKHLRMPGGGVCVCVWGGGGVVVGMVSNSISQNWPMSVF